MARAPRPRHTGTPSTRWRRRGAAVAAALVLDQLLGEPPNHWHPVVWFGSAMTAVEDRLWADRRTAGLAHSAIGVGLGVGAGLVVRSTMVLATVAVAGRELDRAALRVDERLRARDLDGAREAVIALVGRDPSNLDESGLAAAVIESLAENSVDAVIAPVVWAVAAGAPGAGAYRAINTMDAMVGHRSERYRRYGWASARLDDAANLVPARAFALLVAAARPARANATWEAIRADAHRHPSPNAGVAEAAVAGALGLELGGPLRYGDRTENRPTLGTGRRPEPDDIARAVALVRRTRVLAAVLGLALSAVRLPSSTL
ncbi:MAG: adenosylcobinamide-phosphate synthase CbiB [Actinomycetota bacterium]